MCDAVQQGGCAAEAGQHVRTIIWEGQRDTWDDLNCHSHVGSEPHCQTTGGAGSSAKGRMDGKGLCVWHTHEDILITGS